jgi:hypothetical protein
MRIRLITAVAACVVVAGCGSGGSTTPTPSLSGKPTASAGPSPTSQLVGTTVTVLTPLGLNVHSDPATTASVVGAAQQGTELTVLDYRPDNGGWLKVQGQTKTGWIVADPTLTAQGHFTSYSSQGSAFNVLIPANWTFNEATGAVVFRPQQVGPQTIVVRNAATLAALGDERPAGYLSQSVTQEIVCGYTGNLVVYARGASSAVSPSPNAMGVTPQTNYAVIRLTFDSMHAIELAMNYRSPDQISVFRDFYNSITFPFQLCMAQPSAAPAPT